MTVMIDRFFAIPQSAVRGGKLAGLSGVAFKLYAALWHEAERCSTRELTRTTAQIAELVGGARNSHAKARAELVKAGLVQAVSRGTEGYLFHLCNPETGKPWPQGPRERVLYRKKNVSPAAQNIAAPDSDEPPKIADAAMSFGFGFNSVPPAKAAVPVKHTALQWDEIGLR
jgi:hypothetical protein